MSDDLTNRFSYHPAKTDLRKTQHEVVRATLLDAAKILETLLDGYGPRERALVNTKLEEAMFWANAALARAQ